MYTAYYGFREKPFALTPDPKYLFLSATHREVLGHLVYGIEQGEGFMAISGEVGTGKTTLCRTLLDRLTASCEIAFLFNPMLSPVELIQAINGELGISRFGESRPELLDILNTFLLAKHDEGRRVLVIIDEAQNLPIETLEQLRLLSNLESRTSKLLQIVLIGQPELDELLATRELRQLRQRISVWWGLGPLHRSETGEYVEHRLRIASGADRPIFTRAALALVHRYSRGVPRVINVLCDRCLLAGYGDQSAQIGPGIVRRVAREIRLDRSPAWLPSPAVLTAALGIFVAAVASAVLLRGDPQPPDPRRLPAPPVVAARPPVPVPAAAFPEAPPTPEVPPLRDAEALDELLTLQDPATTHTATLAALLRAWGLEEDDARASTFRDLLTQLEGRGLRTRSLTSIRELRELDVPAIVRLVDAQGVAHSALVRALSNDSADLEAVVPGQVVRLPIGELEQRWERPGYAIWSDPARLPAHLILGSSGPPVVWLQEVLADLGHYDGVQHGRFDEPTREAVEDFQHALGLSEDGNVGPITQVRLYQALPEYRTPTLARGADARSATAP